MATAANGSPSHGAHLQHALGLLDQRRFDLAFVAAKRALDEAMSLQNSVECAARCYLVLAEAAAGMGDAEVAYRLFAQGFAKQQHLLLPDLVQQLSDGRLRMLQALCMVPQGGKQAACKRWLRMQQRFATPATSPATVTCAASSSGGKHSSAAAQPAGAIRVFCVSDLHVDRPGGANLAWLRCISSTSFTNDVLIVAGDVGDTAAAVGAAFRLLAPRFRRVLYVPGNHCHWLPPGSRDRALHADSFAKLMALRQMADESGVDTGPLEVAPGLLLLPLLSWHNCEFDVADPRPGRYRHDSFCTWPVSEADVWQVMLKLNTQALALVTARMQQQQQQQQRLAAAATAGSCSSPDERPATSSSSSCVQWSSSGALAVSSSRRVPGLQLNLSPLTSKQQQQQQLDVSVLAPATPAAPPSRLQLAPPLAAATTAGNPTPAPFTVITASHFLPHPELPHSRVSELSKAMGCTQLLQQLDQVSSVLHVYGHSHINTDVTLTSPDGGSSRRYVQYALAAAGPEAAGLYCVWDGRRLAPPGCVVPIC